MNKQATADFIREFKADRLAALRSLDLETILAYYEKYGECHRVAIVRSRGDKTPFWASVHRDRALLDELSEAERQVSRDWLAAHGFGDRLTKARAP